VAHRQPGGRRSDAGIDVLLEIYEVLTSDNGPKKPGFGA